MVPMGESSTQKLLWQIESNRPGKQPVQLKSDLWCSQEANRSLQLDRPLIDAVHARGFEIAVETNGTVAAPQGLDWICVSPKAGTKLVQMTGDELKLVFPQADAKPEEFQSLGISTFLPATDGRTLPQREHGEGTPILPWQSALAIERPDAQICGNSIGEK